MSHIEPVIRPARPADAEAIARLHAESWRASARGIMSDAYLDGPVWGERLEVWKTRLGSGAARFLTLVAVQRDGLHGFICFKPKADTRWGNLLDNLHVDPQLCGRGLGEALMRVGVHQLEELGPGLPLHLYVFAANERAQRFYQRLGGRAEGRIDQVLPDDCGTAPAVRYVWSAPVMLRRTG